MGCDRESARRMVEWSGKFMLEQGPSLLVKQLDQVTTQQELSDAWIVIVGCRVGHTPMLSGEDQFANQVVRTCRLGSLCNAGMSHRNCISGTNKPPIHLHSSRTLTLLNRALTASDKSLFS